MTRILFLSGILERIASLIIFFLLLTQQFNLCSCKIHQKFLDKIKEPEWNTLERKGEIAGSYIYVNVNNLTAFAYDAQ